MSAKLTLDHFDLLHYLEGCVRGSHLRWGIYQTFVNEVWPQLTEGERESIYTYAKRDLTECHEGEYVAEYKKESFARMLARYNPTNQYKVYVKGKPSDFEKERWPTLKGRHPYGLCYAFDGYYWLDWNCRVPQDIIVKVEHIRYRSCTNDCCMSRDTCLRYLDHQKGDEVLENTRPCKKCELYIELEQ